MVGLGTLQTLQGKIRGLLQHNVLAIDEQGFLLGLLHQQYWTRQGGRDQTEGEKESQKGFGSSDGVVFLY